MGSQSIPQIGYMSFAFLSNTSTCDWIWNDLDTRIQVVAEITLQRLWATLQKNDGVNLVKAGNVANKRRSRWQKTSSGAANAAMKRPWFQCWLSTCWRIMFPCLYSYVRCIPGENMTHLPINSISWCPMSSLQSLRPNCLATGKMRFWDAKMKVGKPMKIQWGKMRGDQKSFSTKARYQNHG